MENICDICNKKIELEKDVYTTKRIRYTYPIGVFDIFKGQYESKTNKNLDGNNYYEARGCQDCMDRFVRSWRLRESLRR